MDYKNIFFDWGISDHYGWGIYGLNLLLWGSKNPSFRTISLKPKPQFLYPLDPITQKLFSENASQLNSGVSMRDGDYMLLAIGNHFDNKPVKKSLKRVGVIFHESNPLPPSEVKTLIALDGMIAGSTWNQETLLEMGVNSKLVIQGINTDLFRIQQKQHFQDRFVVFSGGKLEYRKGQDILLKAFSIFSQNRPDSLLISCWRSPWEKMLASSVNASGICRPLIAQDSVGQAIDNWVYSNGVKPQQYLNLVATSNQLMPEIFREVDLAVFPNRCEGGTNLVAMEALCSGIPTALSANTGHLDLIKGNNCIPLLKQSPIEKFDEFSTREWGESSVDELVAVMETAYNNRSQLNQECIRESVVNLSWKNSIRNLLKELDTI